MTKYNKVNPKLFTLMLDKANHQKEKSPREGTRIRDPLVPTLRTLMKVLSWEP